MWSKYLTDPQGFNYPKIRIYHKDFFLNNGNNNILQHIFETDSYWEGRITDMGGFIVNYGWRDNPKKEPLFEDSLSEVDGFICNSCNNIFRRTPLSGRCNSCSGEIVFFKEDKKSRTYNPW